MTKSAAAKGHFFKIPEHKPEVINIIKKIRNEYLQEFEDEPSIDEISEALAVHGVRISERKIKQLLILAVAPISLDKKVGDDGNKTVGDFVEDQGTSFEDDLCKFLALRQTRPLLSEFLSLLDESDRYIIESRTGFNGTKIKTLRELGPELGITHEWVRLLEARGFRVMLDNPKVAKLREILQY
jgi:RNA polymerase primary sigma factor